MAEIIGIYPQWGTAPEPLWREVLGSRLRALRADRDETLAQTAERARGKQVVVAAAGNVLRQDRSHGIAYLRRVGGNGTVETDPHYLARGQLVTSNCRSGAPQEIQECEPAAETEQDSHVKKTPSHI